MAVAQVLGRHAPECRGEHLRFAVSPKRVMADEPTMAPDLRSAAEHFALHKLYEELTTSVIVAMHHMGVIAEATDRVSFCVPGVQSRPDPPRRVLHQPRHPLRRYNGFEMLKMLRARTMIRTNRQSADQDASQRQPI